jgi:hypothetical protein
VLSDIVKPDYNHEWLLIFTFQLTGCKQQFQSPSIIEKLQLTMVVSVVSFPTALVITSLIPVLKTIIIA